MPERCGNENINSKKRPAKADRRLIYLHLALGLFFAFSSSITFLISKRFTVFFEWDFTGFPTPVRLLAI